MSVESLEEQNRNFVPDADDANHGELLLATDDAHQENDNNPAHAGATWASFDGDSQGQDQGLHHSTAAEVELESDLSSNTPENNSFEDENNIRTFKLNLINANARSLVNKMGSLIEKMDEYDITAAMLTETWFRGGKRLDEELRDMEMGENIGIISKNRRGGRGGGVAVAYNMERLQMTEFKFPRNTFELVCAVGNSSASNRKIAIIAVYIPPNQRVATTLKLKEVLTDGINKLKCKFDNPVICVGGDTNNRKISDLLEEHPDVKLVDTPGTRHGAKLDEVATNVEDHISKAGIVAPLASEGGVLSDHHIQYICVDLPAVHHFTKNKFCYRPITEKGRQQFIAKLVEQDWAQITGSNSSESADNLAVLLDSFVTDCFPLVEVSYKSTDAPWIDRPLRRQIRRRRRPQCW